MASRPRLNVSLHVKYIQSLGEVSFPSTVRADKPFPQTASMQ